MDVGDLQFLAGFGLNKANKGPKNHLRDQHQHFKTPPHPHNPLPTPFPTPTRQLPHIKTIAP